jgi:hypothetical protein
MPGGAMVEGLVFILIVMGFFIVPWEDMLLIPLNAFLEWLDRRRQ